MSSIEDVNKLIEEIASIFANLNQDNSQNSDLNSALSEIKTLLGENKIEISKINKRNCDKF